jgi:hypothetical protein
VPFANENSARGLTGGRCPGRGSGTLLAFLLALMDEVLSRAPYGNSLHLRPIRFRGKSLLHQSNLHSLEFMRRQVRVIVAVGGVGPALAAKAATDAIPIVFQAAADPVKLGLVGSINRPGDNATGVTYFTVELGPKRLGLLRELVLGGADVVVLVNPQSPVADSALKDMQAAADAVGQQLSVLHAST